MACDPASLMPRPCRRMIDVECIPDEQSKTQFLWGGLRHAPALPLCHSVCTDCQASRLLASPFAIATSAEMGYTHSCCTLVVVASVIEHVSMSLRLDTYTPMAEEVLVVECGPRVVMVSSGPSIFVRSAVGGSASCPCCGLVGPCIEDERQDELDPSRWVAWRSGNAEYPGTSRTSPAKDPNVTHLAK